MPFMRSVITLTLVSIVVLAAGCKVTSADIEHWKRTQRGPDKLAAVIANGRYGDALRGDALVALATMDRTDVQPLDVFGHSLNGLSSHHDASLDAVIGAAIPGLEVAMRGGERPSQPGQAPSDTQSSAKDAAFLLAQKATGATREHLMQSIMGWFAADFARRAMSGRHGVDEVTREFGAPGALLLLPAIDAKLERDSLPRLATILAAVADDAGKRAAGERFVAIEREMESPAFLEWVKGEVRRAMSIGGATPTDARIVATATLTREGLLTGGALTAMKALSAVPAVSARLLEVAKTTPAAGTPPALITMLQDRRAQALAALENGANASHVQALLALALDTSNPGNVRESAFGRLAETRSAAAIPPMWPIVGATGLVGDSNAQRDARALRARASELVLQIGGAARLSELYAHLPADPATPFEPAELEGYAGRLAAMSPAPAQQVRADFTSPIWWRRVVAIHFVAKSGTASDVALLQRMSTDAMRTVGPSWATRTPPLDTVGKVAALALESLRDRLALPATP